MTLFDIWESFSLLLKSNSIFIAVIWRHASPKIRINTWKTFQEVTTDSTERINHNHCLCECFSYWNVMHYDGGFPSHTILHITWCHPNMTGEHHWMKSTIPSMNFLIKIIHKWLYLNHVCKSVLVWSQISCTGLIFSSSNVKKSAWPDCDSHTSVGDLELVITQTLLYYRLEIITNLQNWTFFTLKERVGINNGANPCLSLECLLRQLKIGKENIPTRLF